MKIDVFKVPEAELNIMEILWDKEVIMTTEQLVLEYRARYGRAVKPSTINTLAGRLMNKGLLTYVQSGGRNLYIPVCRKEKYQAFVAAQFLKVLFNGSITEMVLVMLNEGVIDVNDWEALMSLTEMVEVKGELASSEQTMTGGSAWSPVLAADIPKTYVKLKKLHTKCIPRAA